MTVITAGGGLPLTPERSLQQRRDALVKANHIRTTRSEFKHRVKNVGSRTVGRLMIEEILLAPPAEFETMKVWDLLRSAPKVGRVKVNQALGRVQISPSKTVGGLSVRQRKELVAWMRRHW